jgi:hypothetical protein
MLASSRDVGHITRVRIALRRQLARGPTWDEVETAQAANERYMNISATDIAESFRRGEEVRLFLLPGFS